MSFPSKFSVHVKPNAKKTELIEARDGVYHIAVAAQPEDNKANLALLKFLKKQTGKQARLLAGASSRDKVVVLLDDPK